MQKSEIAYAISLFKAFASPSEKGDPNAVFHPSNEVSTETRQT